MRNDESQFGHYLSITTIERLHNQEQGTQMIDDIHNSQHSARFPTHSRYENQRVTVLNISSFTITMQFFQLKP